MRHVLEPRTGKRRASCHDALPDAAAGTHELLHDLDGPLRTCVPLPGSVLRQALAWLYQSSVIKVICCLSAHSQFHIHIHKLRDEATARPAKIRAPFVLDHPRG